MATTRMEDTEKVVGLLGGRKVFPDRIVTDSDMLEVLRKGFPFAAFEALSFKLEVSGRELADLLGVAYRTLARRRTSRHLMPIESDRLYRIALVTLLATETLGSLEKAKAWLRRENRALGGQAPISLLDTEIGERRVEDTLNRISHGVYS